MSRKGVITKRVKTVQTALSRISAQTAQSGWPRNECSARPNLIRPSEVSAKVQTAADHAITTRETSPRSAKPQPPRHTAHDHAARAGNKPRGRATLAYHGRRPSEPGTTPRPAENHRPNLIRPTTAADRDIRPRPFRLAHPNPADRPDRPSQRRGRPEARFEARFIFSSPA
ncbi:unnamed protein product [Microthlaspi erraticum]|uniref:Uncharacterized protein n=1 Tax=Microthlaspi erraticum TaxID=1685480 RepID=A0A6D2JWX7_9BRAS|nr:unnamed protein product [Microthlaspi erraticum]